MPRKSNSFFNDFFFPTQVSQNYSSKLASLDMLSEMRLARWAKQPNMPNTLDLIVSWQRKPLILATSELGHSCDSRVELDWQSRGDI